MIFVMVAASPAVSLSETKSQLWEGQTKLPGRSKSWTTLETAQQISGRQSRVGLAGGDLALHLNRSAMEGC